MQEQLFCATCTKPLDFKVPDLAGSRWYASCGACGGHTALQPNPTEPEELATFNATGVLSQL